MRKEGFAVGRQQTAADRSSASCQGFIKIRPHANTASCAVIDRTIRRIAPRRTDISLRPEYLRWAIVPNRFSSRTDASQSLLRSLRDRPSMPRRTKGVATLNPLLRAGIPLGCRDTAPTCTSGLPRLIKLEPQPDQAQGGRQHHQTNCRSLAGPERQREKGSHAEPDVTHHQRRCAGGGSPSDNPEATLYPR